MTKIFLTYLPLGVKRTFLAEIEMYSKIGRSSYKRHPHGPTPPFLGAGPVGKFSTKRARGRVAQMDFAMPSILVCMTNSYLPNRVSYPPEFLIIFGHRFGSFIIGSVRQFVRQSVRKFSMAAVIGFPSFFVRVYGVEKCDEARFSREI